MENYDEKKLDLIYNVLAHSIRREIIRYLGELGHRPVSFTELNEYLNVKPGSFYYHLDKMKGLVAQTPNKGYYLTSLGKYAHKILLSTESSLFEPIKPSVKTKRRNTFISRLERTLIFFEDFLRSITASPKSAVQVLIVVIFQFLISSAVNFGVLPLYFDSLLYFGLVSVLIETILSLLFIWIVIELIAWIIALASGEKTKLFSTELLILVPFAVMPLYFYPTVVFISTSLGIYIFNDETISTVVMLLLQIWSGSLLAKSIQITKSFRFERALIVSIILMYLCSVIAYYYSILL